MKLQGLSEICPICQYILQNNQYLKPQIKMNNYLIGKLYIKQERIAFQIDESFITVRL
jgi:hypothetical protein